MHSPFSPFVELINGEAYRPHPEDAALPLGTRFAGQAIVVVGGGATSNGWTQRIDFDRSGTPRLQGTPAGAFRRGTDEWLEHLASEAKATSGWAVALVEKWQAALAQGSVASVGGRGVERMLRVRDDLNMFGAESIPEDALRASVDHPTIDSGITAGVQPAVLETLEKELTSAGFKIASIRVTCFAFLEIYLANLHKLRAVPDRTIVTFDGYSALIIGVTGGAFDQNEGGVSYVVSRPSQVREQIARKLTDSRGMKEWGGRVTSVGSKLSLQDIPGTEKLDIEETVIETALAVVDSAVAHDFRRNLQEVREPLPTWVRPAFGGVLVVLLACLAAAAFYLSAIFRLEVWITGRQSEKDRYVQETAAAKAQVQQLTREGERAVRVGSWVSRNYHAQTLLQGFLQILPPDVSLDSVTLKALEGVPQLKLQFTLIGNEEPQRAALRSIEAKLYSLGYDISRRDDPKASTKRRGGVEHSWDLIIPTFGS